MAAGRNQVLKAPREADVSPWTEALFAAELLLLHATPTYYGFGVPHGDGSGVVIIPGFMGIDLYLMEMHAWLKRIGYQPYFSGIGVNAECPNLLIERRLSLTIERARRETGRRIHVIGHSLGGIIARAVAAQRPKDIASVITLAAPFRGVIAHRSVMHVVHAVREKILRDNGTNVLPTCYTDRCTCDFIDSVKRDLSPNMLATAIYTRSDGVVDWRCCRTNDPEVDFEVPGTHVGLAFNPTVYSIVAERLALAQSLTERSKRKR